MKSLYLATALTCAMLSFTPATAAPVSLNSPDGAISLSGELISSDAEFYVINTVIGEVSIRRSMVECTGADCPQETPVLTQRAVDVRIKGSDTVGDDLMPMLLQGYASRLNGELAETIPTGPDTKANVFRKKGSSDPMLVAEVQAAGSSTGFKALIDREADIAMSSRPARDTEIRAIAAQGRGNIVDLEQEYIVAVDSILTIVSPSNPVDALSMQQLADIYAGRITNWNQVGGPNMPITVVTRPATSGTRGVFEDTIFAGAGQMSDNVLVLGSNKEIADRVQNDPSAIGYVGFAYQGETKSLDLISSCGIRMQASAFGSKTEEYPLQRRLRLFVDNEGLTQTERGLLDFAVSSEADPLVRHAGFIDLSVKIDKNGLSSDRLMQLAALGNDRQAMAVMQDMLSDLTNAKRLSTTFRFNSGSAQLDNKAMRDVARMVEFLGKPENAGREVIIAGYTDSIGDFTMNQRLAKARADMVLATLLSEAQRAGIAGKVKMRTASYSELSPVGCNDVENGRDSNRRVEIWLR